VVPQGFGVLFPIVLGGDFRSPLGGFLGVFLGPCFWGFDGGNMCEPFMVLLPLGLAFGKYV
jgi:hypothetical protein